ncbi:hypothetical protein MNBD_GAMMA20-1803, partial [hydrothermal vent metagenome]
MSSLKIKPKFRRSIKRLGKQPSSIGRYSPLALDDLIDS